MRCLSCQSDNPDGQKFCGACGHTLEITCTQCQASNPAHFKFCGQCGAGLGAADDITLARSGLITQISQKALALLGYQQGEMQGKPFSLFVKRPDLVIFFSHWNELLSKAAKQSFEIGLNHKEHKSIHARLACSVDRHPSKAADTICISLTEITDNLTAEAQLQTQQELLGLTFSMASNISTVSGKHLAQAMEAALKKICLFTRADQCRIHGIDRASNRLESLYQWCHPSVPPPKLDSESKYIALAKVKHTLIRLRQEKTIVIDDTGQLAPPEREEWREWNPNAPGAAICHLIYSGAAPVGVISVAKAYANEKWAPNCAGLVKYFGDLVADRLPVGPAQNGPQSRSDGSGDPVQTRAKRSATGGEAKSAPAGRASEQRSPATSHITRPMVLEKLSGKPPEEQRSVFPRDDGLVLLTCPGCGLQETATVERLEKLGKTVRVSCSCGQQFLSVLEKRRFVRKSVRLEGYFSVGGDLGPIGADGNIWGAMVVQDISKVGLRFTAAKAGLLHPGDLLMVRFNLDNTSHALIHKPARVISVAGHGVGCRFEGDDHYDITLGFYLM